MFQSSSDPNRPFLELVIAIAAIVLGLFLRYWINRRRFNRRNVAGVQIFSNYEVAVFVRFFEFIGKVLGLFLIIAGIAGIVRYVIFKKQAEKHIENKKEQYRQGSARTISSAHSVSFISRPTIILQK